MSSRTEQRQTLIERIRWLRYILPPLLAVVVVGYQLGVAQTLELNYGHGVHYGVEIAFYSLVGPVVTWLTLVWVERSLVEKERLAQQVQARTQQLTSLTAVSADAIFTLDEADLISSWNQGAERMLAYSAAQMIGTSFSKLLPEMDKLRRRLRQDGVVQSCETTAHTGDGRTITVDLTQTRLVDGTKESPASLIIMRDITARHEREIIVEEERARIARDLHDGVAQTLYFLALKADMARQQLARDPDKTGEALLEIGQRTRHVIRDVRRTIFALHPLEWSNGNFWPALSQFVQGFAEQMGWRDTFTLADESLSIPSQLEPTVFRLVQESLNNVAKHAEASQVWVTVESAPLSRGLSIVVRDDGRGFDPAAGVNNGMGVQQMRSRVSAVGGTFQLDSQPGRGTIMTALIPLPGGENG